MVKFQPIITKHPEDWMLELTKNTNTGPKDTDALFQQAAANLQGGRLEAAETLATEIISTNPDHADANHLLGIVAAQRGDYKLACRRFKSAIRNAPEKFLIQLHLGLAKHNMGHLDKAREIYQKIIRHRPQYSEAYYNLGNTLKDLSCPAEALTAYEQVIRINPQHAMAHNNRGVVLSNLNRHEEALGAYDQASRINPGYTAPHINRGGALAKSGRLQEALDAYNKAIAIAPNNAIAHAARSNILLDLAQPREALEAAERAVAINPDNSAGLLNRGIALSTLGRQEEALLSCDQAIRLNPENADAHSSRGVILSDLDRLEEAVEACNRAIQLNPGLPDAHTNLAVALAGLGELDEAEAAFKHAIQLNPENAAAHNNLAMLLLLKGDYPDGWREYEWRWKMKDFPSPTRNFSCPRWDGSSLRGKTILLHAEQGLGDTIQFIRYIPLVAQAGGRIVFECPRALLNLFSDLKYVDSRIRFGDPLPAFDTHSPLMSLPGILGTTLSSVPANIPYLHAPRLPSWLHEQLGFDTECLNIGIVWAGNPSHRHNQKRSLRPSLFRPLLEIPGLKWFSLQVGNEAAKPGKEGGLEIIVDLSQYLDDFRDTASVIRHLDLVISVDTSAAHLAGAMGCPVWVLLSWMPDFRWLLDTDESPWYPTARLFRQASRGDWKDVIDRLAAALAKQSPY